MKRTVFNPQTVSPACEYCINGKLSPDGETVLCAKKGVVAKSYHCRKYKYDVMKREPHKAPEFQSFDKEDFSI